MRPSPVILFIRAASRRPQVSLTCLSSTLPGRRPPGATASLRFVSLLSLVFLGAIGCGDTTLDGSETPSATPTATSSPTVVPIVEHPEGWTEATHESDKEPHYTIVFPDDQVNRLDITIASSDWQAMVDQMTELAGEFGAGGAGGSGGGGGPVPNGDTAACEGQSAGAPCTTEQDGVDVPGTCAADPMSAETLICIPTPSEAATEACAGQAQGATCSYQDASGTTITGQCAGFPGQPVSCQTSMGGPPGDGGQNPEGGLDFFGDDLLWVPSTVNFEGVTWWNVGIRFKGNSSLSSSWSAGSWKLPFKLDFDQFEDDFPEIADQRFYGFKHLSLSNGMQDDSLIREKLMDELLRADGIPAAQAAFYRIYIDHGDGPLYFGLYTVLEVIESDMLEAQLGSSKGNLYKPEGTYANWTGFDEESFTKENNEAEADWSDVEAAISALNADRSDSAAWRTNLDKTLNTDEFLHWLAFNTVAVNWDTYGQLAHNYYLYNDPDDGNRLRWLPWDQSLSLSTSMMGAGSTTAGDLSQASVSSDWPLIRLLMDDEVYRARYNDHVARALTEGFALEPTQERIDRYHALIAPYVVGSEGEQPSYTNLSSTSAFESSAEALHAHVVSRREAAESYLSSLSARTGKRTASR